MIIFLRSNIVMIQLFENPWTECNAKRRTGAKYICMYFDEGGWKRRTDDVRCEMAHLGVEDSRPLAVHLHDQLLVHRYLSAKQQARCHYLDVTTDITAERPKSKIDERRARMDRSLVHNARQSIARWHNCAMCCQ